LQAGWQIQLAYKSYLLFYGISVFLQIGQSAVFLLPLKEEKRILPLKEEKRINRFEY